jgi:hypothetical protein
MRPIVVARSRRTGQIAAHPRATLQPTAARTSEQSARWPPVLLSCAGGIPPAFLPIMDHTEKAEQANGNDPSATSESSHVIDSFASLGQPLSEDLPVQVSYELIRLLSEQLYSSPAKAIEELVVNAWDADAELCSVFIPDPTSVDPIVVFDNGHGMDEKGLRDLWMVGASRKRDDDRPVQPKRKQIGKFGIGKLATYAVANRITYLTRDHGSILSVSVDFTAFSSAENAGGQIEPVEAVVIRLAPDVLVEDETFKALATHVHQNPQRLCSEASKAWTFVVLEGLKPAAEKLTKPRLEWVFRTAMPLDSKFDLLLNGKPIESVDENVDWVVDFTVGDLSEKRLNDLAERTEEKWERVGDGLRSPSLPSGVRGRIRVARESLYRPTTKRADLGRSHGFFVRVLGRLINEEDALFGLKPLSYQSFNRFVAQIDADDLDEDLTAPRETVERSEAKSVFDELLRELFAESRSRYETYLDQQAEKERRKKESERTFVSPGLVEHPVADAVVAAEAEAEDEEAWALVKFDSDPEKAEALVRDLYAEPSKRRSYLYRFESRGSAARLVLFDPDDQLFVLNEDHPIVEEFGDSGAKAKELVEVLATSEAMLEIYLREADVPPGQVRQIIERRDQLLRSLSQERSYSPASLAKRLTDSRFHDKELEAALVSALRLLGFATRHVSGPGNPDGIAEFYDGEKEIKITLEAKSSESGGEVSLDRLGFDGLRSHADEEKAQGCLLVAPAYPGDGRNGQAAKRAAANRISCWTVDDLSRVLSATQRRHLTAGDVLAIVLENFAPGDVHSEVESLLAAPGWTQSDLQAAVLAVVLDLAHRVPGVQPNVDAIAMNLAKEPGFQGIGRSEVADALTTLASASAGGLHVDSDQRAFLRVHPDELRRRVAPLVNGDSSPRHAGPFRVNP